MELRISGAYENRDIGLSSKTQLIVPFPTVDRSDHILMAVAWFGKVHSLMKFHRSRAHKKRDND